MKIPDARISRLYAFVTLLVIILVSMVFAPVLLVSAPHLRAERYVMGAILLVALWAAGVRPRRLLLFVPVIIAHLIILHGGGAYTRAASLGVRAAFFGCAIVLIGLHVMRERRVTTDTIAGAACVYALIGMFWGSLYAIVVVLDPGAFEIPAGLMTGLSGERGFALQYFSFVTLTTVGYGDIHPATPTAAGLAITEAIVGQLYVAVTIARLVGLQLLQRTGKPDQ